MKRTQRKYIYRMLKTKWAKHKCLPNDGRECRRRNEFSAIMYYWMTVGKTKRAQKCTCLPNDSRVVLLISKLRFVIVNKRIWL